MTALPNTTLEIKPNCSLQPMQAMYCVAWTAFVVFLIAGAFAAMGFWPVLPFAGLEVAAFAAALYVSLRRGRYREILYFQGDLIRAEFGVQGQGVRAAMNFARSSSRVFLEAGGHRNSPTRLLLGGGGGRVELARCLTDDERRQLSARMKQLIHPGWLQP